MSHHLFDYDRSLRIGVPEAIYCEGKKKQSLINLLLEVLERAKNPIFLTKLKEDTYKSLPKRIQSKIDYDSLSQTGIINKKKISSVKGFSVSVVSAGTSDISISAEVERALYCFGISSKTFNDVGVAAPWRLQNSLKEINANDLIIVIAGWDAALLSVIGGLSGKIIVGVPTSVGYGVARSGYSALASMLSSCSSGIPIMNIDNGYGAACFAMRIAQNLKR